MKAGWYKYSNENQREAYFLGDTIEDCLAGLQGLQYEVMEMIVVSDLEFISVSAEYGRILIKWLPEGHPDATALSYDGDVWIPVRMDYQAAARKAFTIEPMPSFAQPLYYLGEGVE